MRQIFRLKKVIEKRKHEEFELDAKLHDKDIKNKVAPHNFSVKQRKEFDKQADNLLARMKKDYRDGKRSRASDKDKRPSETIR